MHAKSLQLCPTLCDPMNCSSSGSSVHGILQARILCPPPQNLPDPGIELASPALTGGCFFFFFFNPLLERTLYGFNYFKFVEVFFMTQVMVCPHQFSMDTWKECVFCCFWLKCSVNVNSILLADDIIALCYILADFVKLFHQLLRKHSWKIQW